MEGGGGEGAPRQEDDIAVGTMCAVVFERCADSAVADENDCCQTSVYCVDLGPPLIGESSKGQAVGGSINNFQVSRQTSRAGSEESSFRCLHSVH